MSQVRWGLLSTANINRRLIPAIRASRRGVLAAVASRERSSAEAYAAKWGIPQAFAGYEAMLSSDAVDAVYIGLPNHLHAEWAVKAMQMGKHVLCEKPFALTLAEVDAMIAAAEETGCVLAEAFMYRHHPQTRIIGDWVRAGRLGEIILVRAIFNFRMSSRDNVRLVPEYGGGSLWDVGVYPLSMAQYVMGGPPEWVAGDQWIGESGVDESFIGQLSYSGSRLAQIACSFRAPFHTEVEIIGVEGRLFASRPFVGLSDEPDRRRLLFEPASGDAREIVVPEKELYLGEVEDMHAAILDGRPSYLTLAESRNHVKTVLALYEAARTGQRVYLASS